MNKQEFNKLIESFHKNPGEYTKDEIYSIGVAHKQLLKEEKCWNEVALLVGWDGTGESLRGFINNRMKKDGTLESNPKVLSKKTVENIDDNDLVALKQELIKQQQKTRDEWTTYRRLLREDSRIETMVDAIRGTVSQLKSLPTITYDKTLELENKTIEAILLVSDMHIGVSCDNFYNTYNTVIAIKRVNKLVDDAIDYCKRVGVTKLNVVNLGDLIHGVIHTGARVEQELDVIEQVMMASEILANALNRLQKAAPLVVYRSVIDNHSRAIANKNEAIESENFNKLIDWFLQERLKGTSIVFENDNIDEGLGKFKLYNGKLVMFAHGHQDNINQAFQHFVGASREFVDYALLGHYHCEKAKSYQGAKVIVNGSIVGTEQYALSKRLFSKPSQTLLIFDGDNMINVSIDLSIND